MDSDDGVCDGMTCETDVASSSASSFTSGIEDFSVASVKD